MDWISMYYGIIALVIIIGIITTALNWRRVRELEKRINRRWLDAIEYEFDDTLIESWKDGSIKLPKEHDNNT